MTLGKVAFFMTMIMIVALAAGKGGGHSSRGGGRGHSSRGVGGGHSSKGGGGHGLIIGGVFVPHHMGGRTHHNKSRSSDSVMVSYSLDSTVLCLTLHYLHWLQPFD